MWYIYAVYDPINVVKMLEIYWVWYNFLWRGVGKWTAAETLGLVKGEVRFDHILGFDMRMLVMRHFRQGQ